MITKDGRPATPAEALDVLALQHEIETDRFMGDHARLYVADAEAKARLHRQLAKDYRFAAEQLRGLAKAAAAAKHTAERFLQARRLQDPTAPPVDPGGLRLTLAPTHRFATFYGKPVREWQGLDGAGNVVTVAVAAVCVHGADPAAFAPYDQVLQPLSALHGERVVFDGDNDPSAPAPAAPPAAAPEGLRVTLTPTERVGAVLGRRTREWEGVDDRGNAVVALIAGVRVDSGGGDDFARWHAALWPGEPQASAETPADDPDDQAAPPPEPAPPPALSIEDVRKEIYWWFSTFAGRLWQREGLPGERGRGGIAQDLYDDLRLLLLYGPHPAHQPSPQFWADWCGDLAAAQAAAETRAAGEAPPNKAAGDV